MPDKLVVDNDCGAYIYCEQCCEERFHLRVLKDNYTVEYICETCYMNELKRNK